MHATQSLRDEHRLIRRVLDAFEIALGRSARGAAVERATFEGFLEFFTGFADEYHHQKEEALLFPSLERAGVTDLFQTIVVSDEIGWRKPAPRFFMALCSQLDLPPEHVLLVGDDAVNDYDGALNAGLAAIHYDPRGTGARPAAIRTLDELLAGDWQGPHPTAPRRGSPGPHP